MLQSASARRVSALILAYAARLPRVARLCVVLALVALLRVARAGSDSPSPSPEYRNVQLGAVADFQFSSSSSGIALLGEGGAEYVGIQTFRDRRLVVQWDTLLAIRGGIIGNTGARRRSSP